MTSFVDIECMDPGFGVLLGVAFLRQKGHDQREVGCGSAAIRVALGFSMLQL